ncbi:hypothetical protein BDN71DRAFT_1226663 [Pleurotus eryngii]|uniref:Secreted protein n=1 Tax=Pleurotus eryngii TaxID=5323 RepID=A0A9P5ZQ60_PLEER|nr:hypothetical protein BDN71DRAFT_1226663 [Pleurotus eryngii]
MIRFQNLMLLSPLTAGALEWRNVYFGVCMNSHGTRITWRISLESCHLIALGDSVDAVSERQLRGLAVGVDEIYAVRRPSCSFHTPMPTVNKKQKLILAYLLALERLFELFVNHATRFEVHHGIWTFQAESATDTIKVP